MTPQRPNVGYPEISKRLSPDWIVGFVDGEGCFHVSINKNEELRFNYQILPELTVVQHESDLNLLHTLRSVMGCGVVRRNHGDRYCWRVRKLDNLSKIIIPFFEKHPLKSKKAVAFKKFAHIVRLMQKKEHLTKDGFNRIVKTALSMNRQKRKEIRIKIESVPK